MQRVGLQKSLGLTISLNYDLLAGTQRQSDEQTQS